MYAGDERYEDNNYELVNYEEYLQILETRMADDNSGDEIKELTQAFQNFDDNKTGLIQAEEFR